MSYIAPSRETIKDRRELFLDFYVIHVRPFRQEHSVIHASSIGQTLNAYESTSIDSAPVSSSCTLTYLPISSFVMIFSLSTAVVPRANL